MKPLLLSSFIAALTTCFALCGCKRKSSDFDLSTPQAAAVTFASALEAGDVQRAKDASLASGMELTLIEAMTDSSHQLQRLFNAARARFGEDAARSLNERSRQKASELLASGEVQIVGERATVTSRGTANIVPLKRIDGLWKVDIGALIKGQDLTEAIPALKALASPAGKVSSEIEVGKFSSVDEVRTAMGNDLLKSFGHSPQPVPATAPLAQ